MRRIDLVEVTMQAWARLDPEQRDRFFEAGLKAAVRLGQLEFRAWLLRRVKYPPLSAPADPAVFALTKADLAALKANKTRRSRGRASLSQVSL